ncbi:MAG: hypothetical protein JWM16_5305 [Verrucomicrobiales bacterium]|nr:hypothetical protein [Verrucomicrobiales bacterium]
MDHILRQLSLIRPAHLVLDIAPISPRCMGKDVILRRVVLTHAKGVSLQLHVVKVNMTARDIGVRHPNHKTHRHHFVSGIAAVDTREKRKNFIGAIPSIDMEPIHARARERVGPQCQGLPKPNRRIRDNLPMRQPSVGAGIAAPSPAAFSKGAPLGLTDVEVRARRAITKILKSAHGSGGSIQHSESQEKKENEGFHAVT